MLLISRGSQHAWVSERDLLLERLPAGEKPKRRTPVSYGGRSSVPDKSSQRSRSMSFSPERVRVRGRSLDFNALAANFENPSIRSQSDSSTFGEEALSKIWDP
ncbi:hypothetical protein SAY86_009955 [Trapa natans]|uniref:Uncharacterized protein n=1 Tax=Trapa natans TaxID=22666 RepID=A0AAN7KXT7_TRANT|nr:hypothetical protein SAY86_009955 [Trapa natans]